MTLPTLKEILGGYKTPIEALYDMIVEVAGGASVIESETLRLPADSASDTWEKTIFKAPYACTISEIFVIPDGNIGQATNYMTLDAQNKGAAGDGTDSIGSRAVNSTNTIAGFVGVDLVSTDASLVIGAKVNLKKTVAASGQAFPGGLIIVKYTKA